MAYLTDSSVNRELLKRKPKNDSHIQDLVADQATQKMWLLAIVNSLLGDHKTGEAKIIPQYIYDAGRKTYIPACTKAPRSSYESNVPLLSLSYVLKISCKEN